MFYTLYHVVTRVFKVSQPRQFTPQRLEIPLVQCNLIDPPPVTEKGKEYRAIDTHKGPYSLLEILHLQAFAFFRCGRR